MYFYKNAVLFLLGLLLFYMAMPNIYLHIGWLAWGAFVPLLVMLDKQVSAKKIVFLSWLFFQCGFLALLWINPLTFAERFTAPAMAIGLGVFFLVFPIFFSVVVSLPFVFFTHQRHIRMSLVLLFWIILEYVLTVVPFGFPLSLALSQYHYPFIIQIVEYTGIFGLSAAIVLTNLLFAAIFVENKRKNVGFFYSFLGISIPLCLILYGSVSVLLKKSGSDFLTVVLAQPNIHWQAAYEAHENSFLSKRIISDLMEMITFIPRDADQLLVLPELVLLPFNPENAFLRASVMAMGNGRRGIFIGANYQDRNTVLSLNDSADIVDMYQKNTFVPVFESKENRPAKSEYNPLAISNTVMKVGPLICYETLFPEASRAVTRNGADFLGALSFNSWLGNNNWPLLHMAFMPFRAVENQRASFFLNNTGPSIVTTPYGAIEHLIPLGKRGYVIAKLRINKRLTWYTQKGPLPFLIVVLVVYVGLFSSGVLKK